MAVTVNILGSGSSGNAAVISSSRTRLMFDIGFSKKEMLQRLEQVRISPQSIKAIFVSHEHHDHTCGLKGFSKEFQTPVFMTAGTQSAAGLKKNIQPLQNICAGHAVCFEDFIVTPLEVPHDAREPVAFLIQVEGIKIALLTDLGEITAAISRQLRGCHCLILESNHDVDMLRVGPYPWIIKQRVMSCQGHLSNTAAASFLANDYDGEAEYIVLAHISQINNHPEIALLSAREALHSRRRRRLFGSHLRMAGQDVPAESVVL
jgi:phosphoribosyl 1,2-cyclic phosphodiesterase